MRGLALALVVATLSISCTTWYVNFNDTSGAHYRKRWLGCAGRCDPAFQTLMTREDVRAALEKLERALDTVPGYEHAVTAEIRWDRAILLESRGEWYAALAELESAVSLDASPVYAEERALLRRKLGIPVDAPPPSRVRDADALSDVDEAEVASKCPCFLGREEPPEEAVLQTLIEPGKGVGPIVVGVSTPEHVLRVYGCDCRMTKRRRDGAVSSIDYTYVDAKGGVGTASHRPDRVPNARRPATFVFADGVVSRIGLNIHQRDLATAGGLHVRAPKADVTRILGEPWRIESSRMYEKYRYKDLGIDVWIAHVNDTVGAIHVYK
jgi:hypothetical protein